jgi:hypothetical protein
MKRDPNRGRVEFTDSEGNPYFIKLGVNEYCGVQDELVKARGFNYSRVLFHAALVAGDPSQKDLTIEDAGVLMDDISPARVGELMDQTVFSKNLAAANAAEAAAKDAAPTA